MASYANNGGVCRLWALTRSNTVIGAEASPFGTTSHSMADNLAPQHSADSSTGSQILGSVCN